MKGLPLMLTLALGVGACFSGHRAGGQAPSSNALPQPESPVYEWTCVTRQAAFAGRDGAGALEFQNKMWLLGGWNPPDKVHFPKSCNSEVWSSSDGITWKLELPQAPWEGRHTAGYAVLNGKMWIVGGDPLQGHYQNDVWSSPDGIHWDAVNTNVPWAPRVLHYTVAFKDKLWVIGGQTLPPLAPGPERFYNDVWSSPDGVTWTKVLDHAPWPARGMIEGSAVFQDRIWLLGGGTYETPTTTNRTYQNDVWSSADGKDWKRHLEHAPWPARQYHSVEVFDNQMWVLAGLRAYTSVWHSPDGVNWQELKGTPWPPRHAASVFAYGNALWLTGGPLNNSEVWKLTRKNSGKP